MARNWALSTHSAISPRRCQQPFPGQTYLLSFWLENEGAIEGSNFNEFVVSWNGVTIFDQTDLPAFGWTNFQFVVTATGSNTVLQFGFQNNPSYFGLDDIAVTGIPAPVFQSVSLTNDAIAFTWSTLSSLVYQVQYTTDLTQTNWTDLGTSILASNDTLSVSDPIGPDPQRFYRVKITP